MPEGNLKTGKKSPWARALMAFGCCALPAILIAYVLYGYTQHLLRERLQDKITSIAATGATQINSEDVETIIEPEDVNKPEARVLIEQLSAIRDANEDIRFAYLLRRTADPTVLTFVIDSESLDSREEQEARAGYTLSDDELAPQPGDEIEIDEYPALRDEAFYNPVAEKELQKDQWSTQLSAYAPILNSSGSTIAIFGIDVTVDKYLAQIQATLLPFVLFILFLIILIGLLSIVLIRFSDERIRIFQEIDRQKDELIGIVAHQLGKPITALKWNLEMLLDGDIGVLQKDQQDSMKEMQGVSSHLSDLVSMLLDVSRIELGRMKMAPVPLDLNEFFREIISVIDPSAKERKINFVKDVPANLPVVLLDKRYMRMTVENLLSNAVKYTPLNGTVELKLAIQNGKLYCHVRDNGCGIPKKDQDKIFGKLYRASNVVNTVDGNGFGLYVAKGAIEGQGGKMWFESEEGKGTTFYFEIPINLAKEEVESNV